MGDGFLKEIYDLDTRIVLELDEDQNRLYNAILKTIPKETLADLANNLEGCALSLKDKIEWMSKDHTREGELHRNEPIGTLLKLFVNKSSKRVVYARKELTTRFNTQSYRDQNKILRAFLQSGAGDCDFAGRILRDHWRKELTEEVKSAWTRTRRPMLAYVILRHLPNDYILSEQEELAGVAGYQHVCAVVGNKPGFDIDMSRISAPDQLYVMAKLGREVDQQEAEKSVYKYLLSYDKYYDTPLYRVPSFSSIRGWDRMVWAMGVLGMQDALVRLLEFENKVKGSVPRQVDYDEAWASFVTAIKDSLDPDAGGDQLGEEKKALHDAEPNRFSTPVGEQLQDEDHPAFMENNVKSEEKLFRKRQAENPDMSLAEEWRLFAECFYSDKPRLQNILLDAEFSQEDGSEVISIPVQNAFQEDWLRAGPLDEITSLFKQKTRFFPSSHYSITLKRKDTDEIF